MDKRYSCYVDYSYVFRLERRQRQDTILFGRKTGHEGMNRTET